MASQRRVVIDYTNWKGEGGERRIVPQRIFFGSNQWHPEEQWLLEAFDDDRQAVRIFAIQHIESWKPVSALQ